jgi:hypothetical protein
VGRTPPEAKAIRLGEKCLLKQAQKLAVTMGKVVYIKTAIPSRSKRKFNTFPSSI